MHRESRSFHVAEALKQCASLVDDVVDRAVVENQRGLCQSGGRRSGQRELEDDRGIFLEQYGVWLREQMLSLSCDGTSKAELEQLLKASMPDHYDD